MRINTEADGGGGLLGFWALLAEARISLNRKYLLTCLRRNRGAGFLLTGKDIL